MLDERNYQKALEKLSPKLREMKSPKQFGSDIEEVLNNKDEVLDRYGKHIFSKEHIPILTEEEFKSFLLYKNNHHWESIHRKNSEICADMGKLRTELIYLLDCKDDKKETYFRFNEIITIGKIHHIEGMGRAITTAVLLVTSPKKYGVINRITEEVLRNINLWPTGMNDGKRYEKINEEIFLRLVSDLDVDLWTLDTLWWFIARISPFESN
jgi:hypothetical protein